MSDQQERKKTKKVRYHESEVKKEFSEDTDNPCKMARGQVK